MTQNGSWPIRTARQQPMFGGRATEHPAAAPSQKGRCKPDVLTQSGNLKALTNRPGQGIQSR